MWTPFQIRTPPPTHTHRHTSLMESLTSQNLGEPVSTIPGVLRQFHTLVTAMLKAQEAPFYPFLISLSLRRPSPSPTPFPNIGLHLNAPLTYQIDSVYNLPAQQILLPYYLLLPAAAGQCACAHGPRQSM